MCDSPLLKKCLEVFLKEYLSSYSTCDFVISDKAIDSEKPVFVVSHDKNSNIKKPFSKTKLLKSLDEYFKKLNRPKAVVSRPIKNDISELEKKLTLITEKFVAELVKTIKEYR